MSHPVVSADSTGQRHSTEVWNYSYFQEIPRIIRNKKVNCHFFLGNKNQRDALSF